MENRTPLSLPVTLVRLALCVGLLSWLAGCEAPKKKPAAAGDTAVSADTASDATDTGTDTADSTGGGDASEDTEDDVTDTAVDTGTSPTCDQQLGLLPSTDCGCGGQLICRDQASAPLCIGALPENACGGCGGIAVDIGAACGLCGDGVWTCDPANPDLPSCVGATPQNGCGGCAALPGMEGDSCSASGFFLCVTEDDLACVGPGQNACGGFAALGEALGGPCGECGAGRFVCDGADALRCEEAAAPRNACGGCGTLPNRVGDACGDCDGVWTCDATNSDALVCSQTRNVCGSCGSPGAGALGEACTGGRLVCGVDGQLACESNDRNLCGGTAALAAEPGTGCGSCGGVNICAGPDRVACIGSAPVNGCGGCGFLPGFPGTFCGVDHTWECNGDGTMSCQQTSASVVVSNRVGGTARVEKGQVTVPSGAVTDPLHITIRVLNGMVIPGYSLTSPVLEFGPTGTEFATPLEVQIISEDALASDMLWSNRPADGGGYSEVAGATVDGDALVGDVNHFSIGFTGVPIPDTELCGDGLDNDGDGLADCEDSDCAAAMECAPPTFETDCRNGLDDDRDLLADCEDNDCLGEIGCGEAPVEFCSDGVDNDIDGMTDCADAECTRDPSCGAGSEICDDGIDNDANRLIDCSDPFCADTALCVGADAGVDGSGDAGSDAEIDVETDIGVDTGSRAEVCNDGIDNDGNGWVDCDDGSCSLACGGGAACENASDRERYATLSSGTLFSTCSSLGNLALIRDCVAAAGFGSGCASCIAGLLTCGSSVACTATFNSCSGITLLPPEICDNRLDDNDNGLVDCFDPTCSGATVCEVIFPTELCGNGYDDDGDRFTDCADPDCESSATCGETNCADNVDNNSDGLVDCADADCASDSACFEFACNDFLDDDGDGQTDCLDPDCNGLPQCQELCEDGIDNDGDTLVDCFDQACRGSTACPQQRCVGLGTFAYAAGNGLSNAGFGASMTPCAPSEGCSLLSPPVERAVTGALVPTYEGVCAPRLADGEACTANPADGFCETSLYGGAGCIEGLCRREGTFCERGDRPARRLNFLGGFTDYCLPSTMIAATGGACGDAVGAYCFRVDDVCTDLSTLVATNGEGSCLRQADFPIDCPTGSRFSYERTGVDGREGTCIPIVGAGAACSATALCDETENLVCGAGGTCRGAEVADACNAQVDLLTNTSGVGPDYFAVDRLDGLTASNESLYCSGTVGPEKVYLYTAVAPVELLVEVGTVDGNGPKLAWYARKGSCWEIDAEAACGDASLLPTRGKVQLLAGETVYLFVDSEARWDGGDSAAAEFFIAVTERPVASLGESCADAVCKAGSNCAVTGFCALPACGDGVVDSAERCDDGNSVAGDGCTACNLDTFTESEPNGTLAEANPVGSARRVVGSSNYDWDYYCFDVGPLGGRVGVRPERVAGNCELYREGAGWLSCGVLDEMSFATQEACFYVYSSTDAGYAFEVTIDPFEALEPGAGCGPAALTGAVCSDITGGPGVCRETSPRLHLGICDTTACGDGYLDRSAGEACDDGNAVAGDGCDATCLLEEFAEVEPNNGTLTAPNLNGYRKVTGTLSTTSDYDYFKLTLTQRSHLEFDLDAAAFSTGSNTFGLQVLSSTAVVRYNGSLDTYYGRSGARGGTLQAGAGNMLLEQDLAFLEPGTYTIRLAAAGATTGNYTLFIRAIPTSVVAVGGACDPASYKPCLDGFACSILSSTCAVPLCGDGDVTVGESCDDGNVENGDGCSSGCALEGFGASGISSVSDTPTALDAGARYVFDDGSEARAISLVGPWMGSSIRYLRLQIDKPTRIRAINATAPYSRFRIWAAGLPSSYSSEGTQIAGFDLSLVAYPTWFAATTPAAANAVTCDDLPGDGICTSYGNGTDCVDCGARYAGSPSSFYGYEGRLAPGEYIVELQPYDATNPLWLFLGESPSERGGLR